MRRCLLAGPCTLLAWQSSTLRTFSLTAPRWPLRTATATTTSTTLPAPLGVALRAYSSRPAHSATEVGGGAASPLHRRGRHVRPRPAEDRRITRLERTVFVTLPQLDAMAKKFAELARWTQANAMCAFGSNRFRAAQFEVIADALLALRVSVAGQRSLSQKAAAMPKTALPQRATSTSASAKTATTKNKKHAKAIAAGAAPAVPTLTLARLRSELGLSAVSSCWSRVLEFIETGNIAEADHLAQQPTILTRDFMRGVIGFGGVASADMAALVARGVVNGGRAIVDLPTLKSCVAQIERGEIDTRGILSANSGDDSVIGGGHGTRTANIRYVRAGRQSWLPLSHAKRLGLKHYADLRLRIPRAEAARHEAVLLAAAKAAGCEAMVCGSYRRGRPDCGDIDCLIWARDAARGDSTLASFLATRRALPDYRRKYAMRLKVKAARSPAGRAAASASVALAAASTVESMLMNAPQSSCMHRFVAELVKYGATTNDGQQEKTQRPPASDVKGGDGGRSRRRRGGGGGAQVSQTSAAQSSAAELAASTPNTSYIVDAMSLGATRVQGNCRLPPRKPPKASRLRSASPLTTTTPPPPTPVRQLDIRFVPRSVVPAAQLYFTGSAAHNIYMRKAAQRLGLLLNEYGLFPAGAGGRRRRGVKGGGGGGAGAPAPKTRPIAKGLAKAAMARPIEVRSEKDIFKRLGLPFVPPHLRE